MAISFNPDDYIVDISNLAGRTQIFDEIDEKIKQAKKDILFAAMVKDYNSNFVGNPIDQFLQNKYVSWLHAWENAIQLYFPFVGDNTEIWRELRGKLNECIIDD